MCWRGLIRGPSCAGSVRKGVVVGVSWWQENMQGSWLGWVIDWETVTRARGGWLCWSEGVRVRSQVCTPVSPRLDGLGQPVCVSFQWRQCTCAGILRCADSRCQMAATFDLLFQALVPQDACPHQQSCIKVCVYGEHCAEAGVTRCVPCTLHRTVCTVPQQYASSNRGCILYACNRCGVLPPCRPQHLAKACYAPSPAAFQRMQPVAGTLLVVGAPWVVGGLQPFAGAPSSVFAVCKITRAAFFHAWARVRLSSLFVAKEQRVLVHGRSDSTHAFHHACTPCCTRTSVLTAAPLYPRPYGLHAPWCALQAVHPNSRQHIVRRVLLCHRVRAAIISVSV